MKRIALALLASLALALPVSAAPPGDSATLAVSAIVAPCAAAPFDNRGCIYFQSEPDRWSHSPGRHVVEVSVVGPNASESGTAEIDAAGQAVYYFRFGITSHGTPYSVSYSAYVAKYGDRLTPISDSVSGSLPSPD